MAKRKPELPTRGALERLPGFAEVCAAARSWPAPVYLVGGALRDAALGWPRGVSTDLDLAVPGSAQSFASDLRRRLGPGCACFVLHEETQVYRVAVKARKGRPAFQVDVARLQGKDIREDLARRDFTVNAMAMALPPEGGLEDPCGGLRDLRRGVLRPVSTKAFREDPLRTLRVFRLASQLGLEPSPEALKGVRAARRLVRACSAERVQAELVGLLSAPAAERLRQMDEAGLLTAVLPELEPLRGCARVYYGEGGALKHSLETVSRLDALLEGLDTIYPETAGRIREAVAAGPGGPSRRPALLRFIALIHDVSKPECARRIGGRLRFFEHEARGAQRAGDLLRRLRFSREEADLAALLVRHHLRPGNLAAAGVVTEKAVYRFFRDLRGHGVALLLLCWADHASYLSRAALRRVLPFIREDPYAFDPKRIRGAAPSGKGRRASTAPIGNADTRKTLFYLQVISLLLSRYFDRPEVVRPERLLDGRQVMKLLRIAPGPRVGEVLRLLQEAQAEGRVRTREQAAAFVSSLRAS